MGPKWGKMNQKKEKKSRNTIFFWGGGAYVKHLYSYVARRIPLKETRDNPWIEEAQTNM